MRLYFDSDTTPPLPRKYVRGASQRQLIAYSLDKLAKVTEGQIGIYADERGNGFLGYAIKYSGESPYFEAAE